ncbi:MAG TPA: serine hydrolase [Puia sp.]|jgi:beta-lactamase class A|nr:serine hydrolase [Puia sp.]
MRLLIILFACSSLFVHAQNTDKKLEKKIQELISGFHGEVGIFVQDLRSNRIVAINEDSLFPTASIVKIPIMIGIMSKIKNKDLDYHQVMIYTDSLHYSEGEDILASFKPNEKISLSKLLMLSISTSDNTASLWLQGLAGGGIRINQLLDSFGFIYTRVNSRTVGRENNRSVYGWGQTSPKEICALVQKIINGEIFSKEICNRMLRILGRQYWDEVALSQIPPNIYAADKNGALDECRNEVVYVNAPHPYLFSIFTKNNKDQSWEYNNEAWVLTRKLSRLLWENFNPKLKWEAEPISK